MSQREVPWHKRHLVAYDLETTGPDPDTARIVTADLVQLDPDGNVVSERHYLADPGIDIPEEATAVHGITTEHARTHGDPVADVVLLLFNDIETAWRETYPIVAFNASYDFTVLDRELRRHHNRTLALAGPVLDPLVIDRGVDRYRKGPRKLVAVCEHYGVPLSEEDAHNSAADATAAGRLAYAIAKRHKFKVGRRDLRHLWRAQRAWHREWATHYQEYKRGVDRDTANHAWWDNAGHRFPCRTWADDEALCACGAALDGSGDAAAAAVSIDQAWPLRQQREAVAA
jgi:DNA polymerase-3 subunit epsilon